MLVVGLGLRSGLFEVRYLVLSLPGLALLAGARHRRDWPPSDRGDRRSGLVALVPAALGLSAQYFDPALARDDYRGLVAAIEAEAQPTDVVLLSAPNQVEIFSLLLPRTADRPSACLPSGRSMPQDTLQRLDALKAQYGRVWLVSWAMNEADPPGVIATWLAENGFQASHPWYGSVQLALVGFGPANAPTERSMTPLDNGIVLEGYRLASRTLKPGQTLALTLVWRADAGPRVERWKVFTHLLDAGSQVVAQRDAEPADNLRPTTTWQPGEHIEDNYGITVPDNLPAGSYTLEIGMYDGEKRVRCSTARADHLVLGQVARPRPEARPQRRVRLAAVRRWRRLGVAALGSGWPRQRAELNVLPSPGSLSTQMRPPWRTTISRLMYRPRPMPPVRRETGSSAW